MAKNQGKAGQTKDPIIRDLPLACTDELAAVEFLEKQRWGDNPCCPHCGCCGDSVYKMTKRGSAERNERFLWRCRECGKQYTVRIGTVLEDSAIPLRHWCHAFWMACSCKNGVAAKEIERHTGLSYKSALFLMHRIRYAMTGSAGDGPMEGIVEADETYIGGKVGNKIGRYGRGKRTGRGQRSHVPPKAPVMVMIQRGGEARAQVMPNVTARNLRTAIRENVAPSATLATDESRLYIPVGREQSGGHLRVNHGKRQYVNGNAYTNTAESFFARLKRTIAGTHIHVSKKHLHRYVAQSEFMYNTRKQSDGERVLRAISGAEGKRLMYRDPVSNVERY
ncbi:MAG: IS1595 family transposase [Candidatus Krumholzibacteriia bacterium]